MTLYEALQLAVAVAMPFIVYILHGIGRDVRELRDSTTAAMTKLAVHDAELTTVKQQLHLMEPAR